MTAQQFSNTGLFHFFGWIAIIFLFIFIGVLIAMVVDYFVTAYRDYEKFCKYRDNERELHHLKKENRRLRQKKDINGLFDDDCSFETPIELDL